MNVELAFASLFLEKPFSSFEGDLTHTFFTACAVQCQHKEKRSGENGEYYLLRKKGKKVVHPANSARNTACGNSQVYDTQQQVLSFDRDREFASV